MLIVLGAQLLIPDAVVIGSIWLLPSFQVALLLPLVVANPVRLSREGPYLRGLAVTSAGGVLLLNAATLVHLVLLLLAGSSLTSKGLLLTGLVLVSTNIVAASVVLWELDRGGPFARDPAHGRHEGKPDLLFPQMGLTSDPATDPAADPDPPWIPAFLDYLFVGFTMSTAFSPTDTLPLTHRAKAVFMIGASVAIATFVIVAARAANIL